MFRSLLQWIGCAVLVVAGFALLFWLPDPQQHDAEQARAVQPQPPAHHVEGPAPMARPVSLQGPSDRP